MSRLVLDEFRLMRPPLRLHQETLPVVLSINDRNTAAHRLSSRALVATVRAWEQSSEVTVKVEIRTRHHAEGGTI